MPTVEIEIPGAGEAILVDRFPYTQTVKVNWDFNRLSKDLTAEESVTFQPGPTTRYYVRMEAPGGDISPSEFEVDPNAGYGTVRFHVTYDSYGSKSLTTRLQKEIDCGTPINLAEPHTIAFSLVDMVEQGK